MGLALCLTACVAVSPQDPAQKVTPPNADSALSPSADGEEGQLRTNVRVDDPKTYRFPQLIPPDGIPPVYDPTFSPADEVQLQEDELILGVALDGQAKAYPITILRAREMVNDELAGIPLLVTW